MTNATKEALKLGDHELPEFSGPDAAFGADGRAYPKWDVIPEEYKRSSHPAAKAASGLFFNGGKLADYGYTIKADADTKQIMIALRALLSSFAPPHEVKEATCAWLIDSYCDHTA